MTKQLINESRLNLACGQSKIEGYFGIDIKPGDTVDATMDLEQFPWDIESESAEEIICSHYVEHTPTDTLAKRLLKLIAENNDYEHLQQKVAEIDLNAPSDGLILFMDEVYRILKPGGRIKVIAPYYNSMRCWQDPTHKRAISEATFLYFNKQWRETNKLDHYGIQSDFDFVYGYDITPEWANRSEEARNFAIKHYTNVINDIHVTLTKK